MEATAVGCVHSSAVTKGPTRLEGRPPPRSEPPCAACRSRAGGRGLSMLTEQQLVHSISRGTCGLRPVGPPVSRGAWEEPALQPPAPCDPSWPRRPLCCPPLPPEPWPRGRWTRALERLTLQSPPWVPGQKPLPLHESVRVSNRHICQTATRHRKAPGPTSGLCP